MKNFKSLFLVTGLLLIGCQNAGQLGTNKDEHNQIDVTSTYPYELQTKLEEPVAPAAEPKTTTANVDLGITKENKNKISSNTVVPAPAPEVQVTPPPASIEIKPRNKELSSWQPNEVHLIRGNELINGLQRDLGRKPTVAEMRKIIKSHMGLSAAQAEQLVNALNLS